MAKWYLAMINKKYLNLIIFFFLSLLFGVTSTSFAQGKRFVAILPFPNTGSSEFQWVSRGIEEILYDKLENLSSIHVFEKETLVRILNENGIKSESDLTVRKAFAVGKDTGADVLIAGSYEVSGNTLTVKYRVVSTYTGADVFSKTYQDNVENIFGLFENAILETMNVLVISVPEGERQMLARSATNSISAFRNYCKAYTEFQRGASMETVAALFNSAIQEDPNFWEAQYNLGVIYFNFDQYSKAINQFEIVISRNARFYKPYYGLGVIYYLQRRYDKAIRNFENVLQYYPDHDRTLYYLGRVYVRMDSLKKGLEYLDKSAEINPNYAPTYYQIALANIKRGWYKTAIQALRTTLKLDPDNYNAHNTLGECYYNIQRFDEAIYEYNKATSIRKDFSTAYFNLGNTYYKKGALEEIVDSYLEILETRYSSESNGKGGGLADDLRQLRSDRTLASDEVYHQMIHAYRDAIHYEPGFFEASFNLALTYENLGMADSAKYFYRKTLDYNPNLVRAYMRLGRYYEREGNYQEALKYFKDVVKIEPSYFAATPRLGEEYRYVNIIDEVLSEYQTRLELKPNDPETLLVLARIFGSLGRYGQAEKYYLQIVQLDPQNREATQELQNLRRQMKKL
jgi:tetratricopeptide (TPR) repeat protein